MKLRRFARTLLAAAILMLAGIYAAPPTPWINTGIPSDAFWISKAFPRTKYDMVWVGDSRVLKGISPAAMAVILPGMKIYNFGFDHNAFTEEYLDAVGTLIDQSSGQKTICLGITPQSLTPEAASNNGFLSLRKNGRFDRFKERYLSVYLTPFKPYNFYHYWNLLRGVGSMKYYQHHFSDGWVASRKEPEDPFYQISRYRGRFDHNKVSRHLTQQLFSYIKKWRNQGIDVFGTRLPTSEAMLELESQQSGFDVKAFVDGFEKAGGVWLEIEADGYHSYDGSHLREDSARKLSMVLARRIRELEESHTEGSM